MKRLDLNIPALKPVWDINPISIPAINPDSIPSNKIIKPSVN
jgi:hypothetical protein